jgi:iron complex transport system permease protein
MVKAWHYSIFTGLFLALLALVSVSMMIGPLGWSSPFIPNAADQTIIHYRLSRIILAIIAGSSLAASGASLQALFRNPLADPHIFGISGGAALGAALVIGFVSEASFIMPSAGAIVGGLCSFLLVYSFLHLSRGEMFSQCLLVGILINSVAGALITLLKTLLPMHKTQSLLFWLVGHINAVDAGKFFFVIPIWIVGMTTLWLIKGELEILSFGVEESELLGMDTEKIIRLAIMANCLLIGNVVVFAGLIGFLGLVVPHLIRRVVDGNFRILLPIASLSGALLLVFFDALSRLSFSIFNSEIPTGVLCALVLSPVFFFLLIKDRFYG